MTARRQTITPQNFPKEEFELYSIPAHDRGGPEYALGSEIGSAKLVVSPGDVMISRIIPHIRRATIVRPSTGRRQIASGEWIVLRGDFEPAYLRHYLLSDRFHALFMNTVAGVGGSLVRARPQAARDIELPLPSRTDQRHVAAILDRTDTLRAQRRRTLAFLKDLQRSTFLDMFANAPATATVADIAKRIRTGPFGSQLLHSEFVPEGIAVLGLDNVVANEFRWVERRYITLEKYEQLRRYRVAPGDVLITIMGTIGRCAVVPEDIPEAINTKHICAITPDPGLVLPQFLRAAFLWHPESRAHLRRQTKGSIMDGLNMGIIRAMPIPIPPLEAQSLFLRRQESVQLQTRTACRSLAQLDTLFASLQSRAFSGELTLSAS